MAQLSLASETSLVDSNNAIRLNSAFSDVLLLVGPSKTPIFAHANILSQNCEYYGKALSETWSDSSVVVPEGVEIDEKRLKSLRAVLTHPDVEIETMTVILEFIYTGTATVADSMHSKVALFADQLILPSVKTQCLKHFAANVLTPRTAFEFYVFCDTLGDEQFKAEALLKAGDKMKEAVEGGRAVLSALGVDQLMTMIRHRRMTPVNKWRLLVGWAKARQGCEDVSIESGMTADFNAEKAREDICDFVPVARLCSIAIGPFKRTVVPLVEILSGNIRSLLSEHFGCHVGDRWGTVLADKSKVLDRECMASLLQELQQVTSAVPTKLNLLFRASENSFEASKFHKSCNGKRNTLTLVKTEHGRIVGGFVDSAWDSNGKPIAANET
ncbi:hypothetical protein HDU98_011059, partial [Podochytrium sp. JEL0797]